MAAQRFARRSAVVTVALALACRSGPPSELRSSLGTTATQASRAILTLTEYDEDGGQTSLDRRVRFVDANSRIEIAISKEALRRHLFARQRNLDVDEVDRAVDALVAAQVLARRGLEALGPLAAAAEAWAAVPSDPNRLDALSSSLSQVGGLGFALVTAIQDDTSPLHGAYAPFNEGLVGLEPLAQYELLFDLVDEQAASYRSELDRELSAAAFAVLLEARVSRDGEWRNVHLPGFDAYPREERFRLERWRVTPTDDQKKKFERMTELARSMNAGETSPGGVAEKVVRAYFDGIVRLAETCLEKTRRNLEALEGRGEDYLATEKSRIRDLIDRVEALLERIRAMGERYTSGDAPDDPAALKAALKADAALLRDLAQELGRALADWADPQRFADAGNTMKDEVKTLLEGVKDCGRELAQELEARVREATDLIGLTDGVERSVRTIGAYGEKVLRHTLDSLPASTELDLLDTGQRSVGDGLVFRIGTVDVDASTSESEGEATTLEQRHFELEQILIHFETTVNLGFADPNGEANVNSTWQVVPTYSLLLKRGSRTNALRNRLFDPGYGVHVAALDFDGDDAPELGVGGVVSILRDYLQAGYGYNLSEDRWYAYFGLSLPLGALGSAANDALR